MLFLFSIFFLGVNSTCQFLRFSTLKSSRCAELCIKNYIVVPNLTVIYMLRHTQKR